VCGLTYTIQELVVYSEKDLEERFKKDEKKKLREEYLQWWLSKKG